MDSTVNPATDPVAVVRAWIEGSQRARASQDPADFERLRGLLHPDVEILVAGPWSEEPWRLSHRGADDVLMRLEQPINNATNLVTQTMNLVPAGNDVLVEQVSTMNGANGRVSSALAFLFSIEDGRVRRIRTYRNEANLPPG